MHPLKPVGLKSEGGDQEIAAVTLMIINYNNDTRLFSHSLVAFGKGKGFTSFSISPQKLARFVVCYDDY